MPKRKKSPNINTPLARSGTSVLSAQNFRALIGVVLIVLAIFLAYFPALRGGFILDDDVLLTNNSLIKASDGLYRFWCTTKTLDYWPVSNTTLWIEWRLWEMNPTGYHVTNLILHIVEALLIWVILRKLSIPGAFLAALIFAVHPVNVDSVAWISSRKNLVAMLFFLLSILCYLKTDIPSPSSQNGNYRIASPLASRPSPLWYWLSLVSFLLAMLSKGSVAILPVLLLGIIWWRRPLTKYDLLRTVPFFVISVVLTIVNMWFQTHGRGTVFRSANFIERLLGAGGVVWFYLYKALLPFDLTFIYPEWHIQAADLLWWLPLLAAVVVTIVLWLCRASWGRPILFAWGFFCVSLLPVLGFTDVGFMQFTLVADRYQHIAIIGLVALAAAGWSVWQMRMMRPGNWTTYAVAVVGVCILMIFTWRQSNLYSEAIILYQTTLEKNPNCWAAHNNLGNALCKIDRPQEGIMHCEQALKLKPDYPAAHNNLGNALYKLGRPQEAIEHYQQAIQLEPNDTEFYINLGLTLADMGRPREAIIQYQKALQLDPNDVKAHSNLGLALVDIDRPQEAIEHCEQALRLRPDHAEAYNSMGIALGKLGRLPEAIENFRRTLQLKSDYPEASNNLGITLCMAGQPQEAIVNLEQALRLKPDYPKAHNNLGIALCMVGRPQEAIDCFQQALRLKPDYIEAYSKLASAYIQTKQPDKAKATAQKALDIARSKGQTALAKQIEDWLNSYPAGQPDSLSAPSPSESASPP